MNVIKDISGPYEVLHKLKNKIKKEWKIAFLSAIIIGTITHLFFLSQMILNHDSLKTIDIPQDAIITGRWFLKYICGITSKYILPTIIGAVSIIAIGISSVLIVDMFNVRKKLNIILISAIMVTYPVVASTFSYLFLADGYFIALLLATVSVFLASKYKYGFLIGAVCICFSLGIYQAYISVTIILCIIKILLSVINGEQTKDIIKQILKYFTMGVLGFISYYVVLKLALFVRGMSLSTYQNVDSLGSLNLNNILNGMVYAYKNFYTYITNTSFNQSNIVIVIANIFVYIGIVYIFFKEYIAKKSYKKVFNNIMIIIAVIIIPIGLNIVNLISTDTRYHLVMRYAWCLVYVAFVVLLDKVEIKTKIIQWLGVISMLCIIYNFIIVDNVAYFNAYYKMERSYSIAFRISESIESFDGYTADMRVAIIGQPNPQNYVTTNSTATITNDITGVEGNFITNSTLHYKALFEHYFAIRIVAASSTEIERIQQTEEFKEMPTYPDEDSIRVINDILVIKLSY